MFHSIQRRKGDSTFFMLICLITMGISWSQPTNKKPTEFIILHNNDMHARFEQISIDSGKCPHKAADNKNCYGGFARVAHEVRKFRKAAANGGTSVLYLNAGDTYTGTPWFTVFKDNITAAFLNKLKPDAISLGNHEFDEGIDGLLSFLTKVEFPVLACNLDLSKVAKIRSSINLAGSIILKVHDVKVAVVGYLTPDTKFLVQPNEVEFKPEIESINEETYKLKATGVNIIIALGHSGYHKDMEIAASCPDVDIVIGGHTNTFLYSGAQPNSERIEGPYPTIVKQATGKRVPVVQAYAYTKYLGKLHVQFDKNGNLIKFDGTSILLNSSIPRDNDVLQLLEDYRPNITTLENNVVGTTKVHLDGRNEICRTEECNLGNLIADSMVYARVMENQRNIFWTDAAIAFIMGGGIRSSIGKRLDGTITETDVLTVLPFRNDVYVTKISGKTLRNALEHSANIRNCDSNGGFLQMSGVQVTYDYNRNYGDRAISVRVRCSECDVPLYEELVEKNMYNVIVPEFLLAGGDGHIFENEDRNISPIRLQKNDHHIFVQYLNLHNFVQPELDGRIIIMDKSVEDSASTISNSFVIYMSVIVLVVLFR